MDQETALYLADHACPSIAYRVRKEILYEDISAPEMKALQEIILCEPEVKRILFLQKEDGWLGGFFHGVDEPESGIRYLMEKGVEPNHPTVQAALRAIENRGDDFDKGSMERVGKPLDEGRLGGSKLIRACAFAYAGAEAHPFVREGIEEALEAFRFVCNVTCMKEICETYKSMNVFRQGVIWPCVYHLRLLAYTNCWRTEENHLMLARAVVQLAELSPIPGIKLLHKYQVISPASVYMNDFNSDMVKLSDREWMMWFHRTELIARLGVIAQVDTIIKQVRYVEDTCLENGLFTKKLRHYYFTKWTQYIGLALEQDWKAANRQVNDLTFRWLMIQLHM